LSVRVARRLHWLVTAIVVMVLVLLGLGVPTSPNARAATRYRIALSNSYIGNQWRVEMENILKAYARQQYGQEVDLSITNSGTDVQAQIAAIDNMISQHVNAILVDPASESALNPVLEQATRRGIVVVDFDHLVTAPDAYKVGVDFVKFGELQAQWLATTLHGKGNVILNRGVPGFEGDIDEYRGEMNVLKKYSAIHVIAEIYGKWDETVSQEEMTKALTAHPNVDGVINQAGAYGATQAFLNLHHALVPMAGEASNGWRLMMLKYEQQGLKGISVGDPPTLGAYALKVAVEVLGHSHAYDKHVWVNIPSVTTEELKSGVNVFPNLPPTVYDDIEIPGSGINVTIQDALKG
jgi:ribose transport system substrate-binding protein